MSNGARLVDVVAAGTVEFDRLTFGRVVQSHGQQIVAAAQDAWARAKETGLVLFKLKKPQAARGEPQIMTR